jgi:hypothetical protein
VSRVWLWVNKANFIMWIDRDSNWT